jgi:hypothetical protein
MSLTDRQRKIINPYADSLLTEERAGAGYDYENKRNRFVIDAIQERYIYFFQFPKVGDALNVDNVEDIEDASVTEDDLLAYFALYPQNGKMVSGNVTEISNEEAEAQLELVIQQLRENDVLQKYLSKTSELSYQEDYENRQDIANLISIPPAHSNSYRKNLRAAFSLPEEDYSGQVNLSNIRLSARASTYVIADANVDLYDWRKNCEAGSEEMVYYNSVDRNYYFTTRTDFVDVTDGAGYTTNFLRSAGDGAAEFDRLFAYAKTQYTDAVTKGIEEILLATGKRSRRNLDRIKRTYLPPNRFILYTYLDTRPGSRWTYAVKIPAEVINSLPTPQGAAPSREETEISSLSKAKRIIGDENNSITSVRFHVEDMIRYIFYGKRLLRQYDKDLYDLGLFQPGLLKNIDLSKESDRLNSFFDLLELFYTYNKISLQDTDYVEMFFNDKYGLEYIIVNGSFYYQATGTTTFLNEEESPRVLNAFSIFTPTTFSIIKNAQEIYNEAKITSPSERKNVITFMTEYLFPTIDIEEIKRTQAARQEIDKRKLKKRKKLFETYKRVTGGDPKDFEFLYSNRPLKYTLTSTLNNMDCDTGQVYAVRQALLFWQNVTSKTPIQSVVRQLIILLRDEVIQDEAFKMSLTDAEQFAANPNRALKDIESRINRQIFCSLDVLGDFIEDQFLDPLGLPPEASRLTRQSINGVPKIEFKKCSMVSLKATQSSIYQKMLESILLNFLKSILAGIAKDFLKAILGCGPDSPNTDLKNSLKKEDYGFINLMDFLDEVDVVALATMVGIKKETEEGPVEVTLQEMTDFIEDVSTMSTPIEIQQLLNGDAGNDLLRHIIETVTGTKDITRSSIRVSDYDSINFTSDNISNFFFAIGEALDGRYGDLGEMGLTSPLEAYCNSKDGFINPLALEFSTPEIEAQYNDIINSKIGKINSYCNMLRDLTNIESEIQRLIESLPVLGWYDDLLREIARLSNQLAEWLAGFIPKLGTDPSITREQPTLNLYNTKMGTELFYQIFFSMREVLINQLYFSNSGTFFQTPAGFSYNRLGYQATLTDRFFGQDDALVRGNFGGRRNAYTRKNVYKYIWSDPRHGTAVAPKRLNIPQYRNPIVPPYDHLDAAYYSIRNSPTPLITSLGTLLSPANLEKINYGEAREQDNFIEALRDIGRDGNQEIRYLTRVSNKVYDYLNKGATKGKNAPGWTGATYLRCSPPERGNIQIFFNSEPFGKLDEASRYSPSSMYSEVAVSSSLAPVGIQGDYDVIDYRIFQGTEFSGSEISVTSGNRPRLVIDDVTMPALDSGATITFYSNLSIGVNIVGGQNNERRDGVTPYNPSVSIQNYSRRIDTAINNSVVSDIGRRRMPRYVAALNKISLQKTDDICVSTEDIVRAEAAIRKIQSNMFSFFVNIMPMASDYPHWRSNGTVKMIADYLTRKLIKDLEEKEILGSFYELIPFVKLVYPRVDGDEEFDKNPFILDSLTPRQNTQNIVEAVYIGVLDNISKTSEYEGVNKSVFDPSTNTSDRYRKLLGNFYKKIQPNPGSFLPSNIREDEDAVAAAREKLSSLFETIDGEVVPTDLGMVVGAYYFPIAFQIASYMIYMDSGIRFSERYSDMKYRMLLEEAGADDSLLTAVKGQLIQKFAPTFAGFPVTVSNYLQTGRDLSTSGFRQRNENTEIDRDRNINARGYGFDLINTDNIYYSSQEVVRRLQFLDSLLPLDDFRQFSFDTTMGLGFNPNVLFPVLRRGYNLLRLDRGEPEISYSHRARNTGVEVYSAGGQDLALSNFPTITDDDIVEIVNRALVFFQDENYRVTTPVGRRLPLFDLVVDQSPPETPDLTYKDAGVELLQTLAQQMRSGQTPLQDMVTETSSVAGYSRATYVIGALYFYGGYQANLGSEIAKVAILEEKNILEKLINRNE